MRRINVLIKTFPNIHEVCNREIHNFFLFLRKGVYPYQYMDSWERFDETSLPDEKSFYSDKSKQQKQKAKMEKESKY